MVKEIWLRSNWACLEMNDTIMIIHCWKLTTQHMKNGISHCLKTLVVVNFLTKVSLDGTVMRLVTVNHHCQDLFLDLKSHLGWSFCRLSSLFPEFYSSTFNFPPYLIVNAKDSNVTLETMEESLHKGALAEEHFHCKTLT